MQATDLKHPGPAGPPSGSPPPRYWLRRAIAAIAALVVVIGLVLVAQQATSDDAEPATTSVASPGTGASSPASVETAASTVTTVASIDAVGSLWWVVNPHRPIDAAYVPADLVTPKVPLKPGSSTTELTSATAAGFEAMAAEAHQAGHALQLTSGYRSFDEQQELFRRFVADFGEETARQLVAVPGTSEHQTGLAADVGLVGLPDDRAFGDTPASRWVEDNAHRFGFILRYPPAKSQITGYANEPWHLRYVGVELATTLHASGLTMEEHFGLAPVGVG